MANNPLKIAQGFPGQMGLLAKQMNNGFGGGLLAQQNYLNSIYDPVVMPQPWDFGVEGGGVEDKKKNDTKKGTKTPIKPTVGGPGGGPAVNLPGDRHQPYVFVDGQWVPNPNYRLGSDR